MKMACLGSIFNIRSDLNRAVFQEGQPAANLICMRLRAERGKLKIEHSIIDGLRPVLERLLRDSPGIRSVIPGVIRPVRNARGLPNVRITVPVTNGWKAIALSAGARQELFISTDLSKDELELALHSACHG